MNQTERRLATRLSSLEDGIEKISTAITDRIVGLDQDIAAMNQTHSQFVTKADEDRGNLVRAITDTATEIRTEHAAGVTATYNEVVKKTEPLRRGFFGRLKWLFVGSCVVMAMSSSAFAKPPKHPHPKHHSAYTATPVHRSVAAKHEFWKQTGHPHGWSGHVVDHIVPLACGGPDTPSNMQWQTVAEGKAKDKVELRGCRPTKQ